MSDEEKIFRDKYALHMSTWGPHCGAPYAVYEGHLRALLTAHELWIAARERALAERE